MNELLGAFNYVYQIFEDECFARGKKMADSGMEFPRGMYEDFSRKDELIWDSNIISHSLRRFIQQG
jgi:hypothetical protein